MNFTNYCSFLKPGRFLSLISMTGIRAIVPIRRGKNREEGRLDRQLTVFILCVSSPSLFKDTKE